MCCQYWCALPFYHIHPDPSPLCQPLLFMMYISSISTEIEGGISVILKVQAVAFLGEYEGWGREKVTKLHGVYIDNTERHHPSTLAPLLASLLSSCLTPLSPARWQAPRPPQRGAHQGRGRGRGARVVAVCAHVMCSIGRAYFFPLSFPSAFLVLLSPSLPLSLPVSHPLSRLVPHVLCFVLSRMLDLHKNLIP